MRKEDQIWARYRARVPANWPYVPEAGEDPASVEFINQAPEDMKYLLERNAELEAALERAIDLGLRSTQISQILLDKLKEKNLEDLLKRMGEVDNEQRQATAHSTTPAAGQSEDAESPVGEAPHAEERADGEDPICAPEGWVAVGVSVPGAELRAHELRRHDREDPPWDSLDPGIVGAVRALVDAGFRTWDSGDGRHKREQGWEKGSYSDFPHVFLPTDNVQADSEKLYRWMESVGLDECGISAVLYAWGGELRWQILLEGEQLYGWSL